MSNVAGLRRQILGIEQRVTAYERTGERDNLARELSVVSFRQHLDELRGQLTEELTLRGKEIIEIGIDEPEPGTIPLHLLAKIADNYGQAVQKAARYRRHGTFRGPVPQEITDSLDLRLAALKGGSTHLYITGRTAPDLFGNSLIEDSLRETFAVLQASSSESLTDAVSAVGYSSAAAIKRLLREVARSGLALEIKWRTPSEQEIHWQGDPLVMGRLADSLDAFSKSEPGEVEIEGKVITVSLREHFVIERDSGESYSAVVAEQAMPQVESTTPGTMARATLIKNAIKNKVTGREKVSYTLVNLARL